MTVSTQPILFALAGLLVGCCCGFALANALSGRVGVVGQTKESSASATNNSAASKNLPVSDESVTLSDEEISRALARAEASPRDRELQFNLGRALYFYASQTRSAKILPDAERLIRRAHELQPDDEAATLMLGNILFDLAQTTDAAHFTEARKYYLEALKAKPSDADVLMDVGRTFYYERPAQPQRAIEFYRRALAVNPQHEATLQNLINALLDVGNTTEAEKKLKDLQTVNPQNATLPNLSARLEQARNARN